MTHSWPFHHHAIRLTCYLILIPLSWRANIAMHMKIYFWHEVQDFRVQVQGHREWIKNIPICTHLPRCNFLVNLMLGNLSHALKFLCYNALRARLKNKKSRLKRFLEIVEHERQATIYMKVVGLPRQKKGERDGDSFSKDSSPSMRSENPQGLTNLRDQNHRFLASSLLVSSPETKYNGVWIIVSVHRGWALTRTAYIGRILSSLLSTCMLTCEPQV